MRLTLIVIYDKFDTLKECPHSAGRFPLAYHPILPRPQFLNFKKAFIKFDTDGNGYITKSELKKAMKDLGEKLSKEELTDMMNEGNR